MKDYDEILEKQIIDSWTGEQDNILHSDVEESLSSQPDFVAEDKDSVNVEKDIEKFGDKLVGLTTMGFRKPGPDIMTVHEMIDHAANDEATFGTNEYDLSGSMEKIVDRIKRMSVGMFNGVSKKTKNQLRNGDISGVIKNIEEAIAIENDGNKIHTELYKEVAQTLLPIAKHNAGEKFIKVNNENQVVLDKRIEEAGYL
tara:strand:- start:716 stop:1312 length:597 start_codon:yes stop_codon:yes gene_type:complete